MIDGDVIDVDFLFPYILVKLNVINMVKELIAEVCQY